MTSIDEGGNRRRTRSRSSLIILASIAFVPLLVAYTIFFHFPSLVPSGTVNQGTLINPPLTASDAHLAVDDGKWTLLLPSGASCGPVCSEKIYLARQVNVGLNKDADRVQRLLVVSGVELDTMFEKRIETEYPEMRIFFDTAKVATAALAGVAPGVSLDEAIFLVDPKGFIILYYRGQEGGKPLLKDLKHLLKLSKIG